MLQLGKLQDKIDNLNAIIDEIMPGLRDRGDTRELTHVIAIRSRVNSILANRIITDNGAGFSRTYFANMTFIISNIESIYPKMRAYLSATALALVEKKMILIC